MCKVIPVAKNREECKYLWQRTNASRNLSPCFCRFSLTHISCSVHSALSILTSEGTSQKINRHPVNESGERLSLTKMTTIKMEQVSHPLDPGMYPWSDLWVQVNQTTRGFWNLSLTRSITAALLNQTLKYFIRLTAPILAGVCHTGEVVRAILCRFYKPLLASGRSRLVDLGKIKCFSMQSVCLQIRPQRRSSLAAGAKILLAQVTLPWPLFAGSRQQVFQCL